MSNYSSRTVAEALVDWSRSKKAMARFMERVPNVLDMTHSQSVEWMRLCATHWAAESELRAFASQLEFEISRRPQAHLV